MVFGLGKNCTAWALTDKYSQSELIGSLLEIECNFFYHHWGVIVEIDDRDVYMIHLTNNNVVTRQLVADYAGNNRVRINNKFDLFCTLAIFPSLVPEEIVKRAKSKLGYHQYNKFTSNCEHFANWCSVGDKAVETAFIAVTELIKMSKVGDIVELRNGLFGIVTQNSEGICKVATSVMGKIQEVLIENVDNEGKINNSFDKYSAPYKPAKIVKNARNFIGQTDSDSHSFVKNCRNGI